MTELAVSPPTDFWGIVFPNYLAAAGAVLGTVVAVLALIVSVRTRATTAEVKAEADNTRDVLADTIDAAASDQEFNDRIMRAVARGEDPFVAGMRAADQDLHDELLRTGLYKTVDPEAWRELRERLVGADSPGDTQRPKSRENR